MGIPRPSRCVLLTRLGMLLAFCFHVLWFQAESRAQVSHEYDVKAVFLLNFAQFVEWPTNAFPAADTPFTIGVFGVDPFSRTLDDVVQGEMVKGRYVKVERFPNIEDIKVCHILFVSAHETRRLPELMKTIRDRPILTVSDRDGFLNTGGIIRMYTEEKKIRLRINNEAAKRVGLTISSKLLRVAEVLTSEPPDSEASPNK